MFKRNLTFINYFLAAIPPGFLPHFQTRKQCHEFFGSKPGATLPPILRPGEAALLQPFGANPQTTAIPKENLHSVALLVGEHKPMATERVLLQHRLG
jgi:hypothetical protein